MEAVLVWTRVQSVPPNYSLKNILALSGVFGLDLAILVCDDVYAL